MSIITYLKNLLKKKPRMIVVCGPTATGKTALGIQLAKRHDGEVISADSRQVYRGLDIGTAKVTREEMGGIPHHMIDVADPKEVYSVAEFKKEAQRVIADIHAQGKLPIIVGGSGQYIDAILYDQSFPTVPPNKALRKKLEQLDTIQLFARIVELDKDRAKTIDKNNRVRLIRAVEIAETLGYIPKLTKNTSSYTLKIIYLDLPNDELMQRIHDRNVQRLENGLIEEVKQLHADGLSWERMHALGLEYRYVAAFLQGQIASKEKLLETLDLKIRQFAKRQRTWFRKYSR